MGKPVDIPASDAAGAKALDGVPGFETLLVVFVTRPPPARRVSVEELTDVGVVESSPVSVLLKSELVVVDSIVSTSMCILVE